jgi:hypothetical protein
MCDNGRDIEGEDPDVIDAAAYYTVKLLIIAEAAHFREYSQRIAFRACSRIKLEPSGQSGRPVITR